MAKKEKKAVVEHKLFHARFPRQLQGVNFHWCYENQTSMHEHDFYEFVLITEGKVRHIHNGESHVVSKGMLFLIKPGEFHQFLPHHNCHAEHINFSITPTALSELSQGIWLEDVTPKVNEWKLPPDLTLPKKDFESLLNATERLNQFTIQSKNTYAVIKNIIIEILLFYFHKSETLNMFAVDEARPAWLNEFLSTLNDPNVFTMKLADIYPLAPYSQSMLNIYFNKYMGMTLITYITKMKINYACTLLRHTDASPLEISVKLGYDSLSHFNRIFKKITYMSPIAYRKQVIEPNNP